ncbi:MAG: putative nucleotidyltransferase, GrpB family [Devosia sp.]|uniref:GrpB family protein n=1 Tax=Devosia sp. TaxID=1871048 RepID=UPI00263278B9|nr:GrpB family protein [Devosia sp.]MDB5540593.1 putative nucleotidyltransferase, GrpB family [Devosia sp.]
MPPAFPVELKPHDPQWAAAADREAGRLRLMLGDKLVTVHHIGSTSIPGLIAKPILDLLPVVRSIGALDDARARIEGLGYQWWGEFGLPGRRYCTLVDKVSGKRLVQLHCYEDGSPEVTRHLAFRDYLRAHPELAAEYEAVKRRCAEAHPDSSHAYAECKGDWVKRVETEALAAR